MKINLPLKDFYIGKTVTVLVEKQVACPHCKGTGA
jgi:DnaJ-class molecular chaperone